MRIDAAVDAMTSFGFSEEIVRKTVKELLKVLSYSFFHFSISPNQKLKKKEEEGNKEKNSVGLYFI